MSEDRYSGENRREHYRIIYPLTCRPKLRIVRKEYDVVDISESGVKFLHNRGAKLTPGSKIEAEITFDDGSSLDIHGEILRINDNILILKLHRGIPFWKIVDEQRYVKNKYPGYTLS